MSSPRRPAERLSAVYARLTGGSPSPKGSSGGGAGAGGDAPGGPPGGAPRHPPEETSEPPDAERSVDQPVEHAPEDVPPARPSLERPRRHRWSVAGLRGVRDAGRPPVAAASTATATAQPTGEPRQRPSIKAALLAMLPDMLVKGHTLPPFRRPRGGMDGRVDPYVLSQEFHNACLERHRRECEERTRGAAPATEGRSATPPPDAGAAYERTKAALVHGFLLRLQVLAYLQRALQGDATYLYDARLAPRDFAAAVPFGFLHTWAENAVKVGMALAATIGMERPDMMHQRIKLVIRRISRVHSRFAERMARKRHEGFREREAAGAERAADPAARAAADVAAETPLPGGPPPVSPRCSEDEFTEAGNVPASPPAPPNLQEDADFHELLHWVPLPDAQAEVFFAQDAPFTAELVESIKTLVAVLQELYAKLLLWVDVDRCAALQIAWLPSNTARSPESYLRTRQPYTPVPARAWTEARRLHEQHRNDPEALARAARARCTAGTWPTLQAIDAQLQLFIKAITKDLALVARRVCPGRQDAWNKLLYDQAFDWVSLVDTRSGVVVVPALADAVKEAQSTAGIPAKKAGTQGATSPGTLAKTSAGTTTTAAGAPAKNEAEAAAMRPSTPAKEACVQTDTQPGTKSPATQARAKSTGTPAQTGSHAGAKLPGSPKTPGSPTQSACAGAPAEVAQPSPGSPATAAEAAPPGTPPAGRPAASTSPPLPAESRPRVDQHDAGAEPAQPAAHGAPLAGPRQLAAAEPRRASQPAEREPCEEHTGEQSAERLIEQAFRQAAYEQDAAQAAATAATTTHHAAPTDAEPAAARPRPLRGADAPRAAPPLSVPEGEVPASLSLPPNLIPASPPGTSSSRPSFKAASDAGDSDAEPGVPTEPAAVPQTQSVPTIGVEPAARAPAAGGPAESPPATDPLPETVQATPTPAPRSRAAPALNTEGYALRPGLSGLGLGPPAPALPPRPSRTEGQRAAAEGSNGGSDRSDRSGDRSDDRGDDRPADDHPGDDRDKSHAAALDKLTRAPEPRAEAGLKRGLTKLKRFFRSSQAKRASMPPGAQHGAAGVAGRDAGSVTEFGAQGDKRPRPQSMPAATVQAKKESRASLRGSQLFSRCHQSQPPAVRAATAEAGKPPFRAGGWSIHYSETVDEKGAPCPPHDVFERPPPGIAKIRRHENGLSQCVSDQW